MSLDGDTGFSTYGASASSLMGDSDGERGLDRFVSARGGEETEVEELKDLKKSSSEEVDKLALGKGSTGEINSLADGV